MQGAFAGKTMNDIEELLCILDTLFTLYLCCQLLFVLITAESLCVESGKVHEFDLPEGECGV